jgi:hypothetical protein
MEPKKLLIALALLVGAVLLPAAPAAADADPLARVVYPLAPTHAKGTVTKVQIEGSADDWGLRLFAARVDAQFAGLMVRTWGTCAQRPTWACVTVTTGAWDDAQQLEVSRGTTGFLGLTDYTGYNRRAVYLNTRYLTAEYNVNPYAVAAHEFGHVLGLNHHQQDGVCGAVPDVTTLGVAEVQVLTPYYGYKPKPRKG